MPSYVLDMRLSGENRPAAFPSGTSVIDFRHDDAGGTVTLYEFTDADLAANFADLVKGELFPLRKQAERAYREATSA